MPTPCLLSQNSLPVCFVLEAALEDAIRISDSESLLLSCSHAPHSQIALYCVCFANRWSRFLFPIYLSLTGSARCLSLSVPIIPECVCMLSRSGIKSLGLWLEVSRTYSATLVPSHKEPWLATFGRNSANNLPTALLHEAVFVNGAMCLLWCASSLSLSLSLSLCVFVKMLFQAPFILHGGHVRDPSISSAQTTAQHIEIWSGVRRCGSQEWS